METLVQQLTQPDKTAVIETTGETTLATQVAPLTEEGDCGHLRFSRGPDGSTLSVHLLFPATQQEQTPRMY